MNAKILIRKPDRNLKDNGCYHFLQEPKEFSTHHGKIEKDHIAKGGKVESARGKQYWVFDAQYADTYKKISRRPQIIPLKDVGNIIATTGLGKDSKVLEFGAGSGGFSLFTARFVKQIDSFDINEKHKSVVEENKEFLGIKNVKVKEGDAYEKIKGIKQQYHVVMIDVPEPWRTLDNALAGCIPGGFIVSYSPCITQNAQFVNECNEREDLLHLQTVEVMEREWKIEGRAVRPKSKEMLHSGFISYIRRLG